MKKINSYIKNIGILFIFNISYSQTVVLKDTTCFSKQKIDTIQIVNTNEPTEFCVVREYINRNIFYEYHFFGKKNYYKRKKNKWYIYFENKWTIMFSHKSFINKESIRLNEDFYLIPFEIIYIEKQRTYKYQVSIGSNKNAINYYVIFNPSYGFTEIIYNNYSLIRSYKPDSSDIPQLRK